jgi:hypothetical protein
VRELRAHVDVVRARADRIQELREGLPVPRQALGEDDAGMSSTPSMSFTRSPWSSGRHGAKPTPQFPITTVVTPCHDDGARRSSHVACPS